jgi:PAS domain S-box-containing protein
MSCEEILLNISEAILVLDSEGYISYANPAAATVTGYNAEELSGKPISFLYDSAEDEVKAEYELNQARKNGKYSSESWKAQKTGNRYWGSMIFTAMYGPKKEFTGFSCILQDITERKQREIGLRKSEERYRLMVESVKDYAIFLLDATGHIVTWNDGAARIKGYTASEITGKHFSIFYPSEDLDSKKPERELKIATETGKYEEEGWRVRKNGSVFWASVVITALYNEQNRLIGFSKVTRDLSERRQSEEILRQSEERYRSLVEQVTDYGIFMMDEKGRIVSWNEGAKRIKGYTAQEIIGKYFSLFYPEEDVLNGKPAQELKIARAEGKYEEEGWRIRKDGSRFWASVVITAVYSAEGSLIGYSKVTRDLTERKESERALRDSYERYRRLAGELKIINGELSYANGELEQFTSIVSHDLQEPIRTIQSFLQLIAQRMQEERYDGLTAYINKTVSAAGRMRELILNLLHYSQLGKMEVARETLNMKELVNQAMQNVKKAVETSNAQVTIENNVDHVEGNPVQLVQLMQNLVSNALKFTDGDRPSVKISCDRQDSHIQCSVSDNGIGIAHDDLGKVFEIFKRLNTEKEFPGTGIGLAICKKIVDMHGGRIWVESEQGKGTTFYFTLHEKAQAE